MSRSPESSPRAAGVWRVLSRLLVLLVVPVVVVGQTRAADAATYGTVGSFSVTQDNDSYSVGQNLPGDGWTMACSGTGAYVADGQGYGVVGQVKCRVDVEYWDDPNPGELNPGTVSLLFRGTIEGSQSPCTYAGPPASGDVLTSLSYASVITPYPCLASEVCVESYVTDPGQFARYDYYGVGDLCSPISLGPLPKETGSCPYGTPYAVNSDPRPGPETGTWSGTHARYTTITVTPAPGGSGIEAAPGQTWKQWRYVARFASTPTTPNMTSGGIWRQENTVNGSQGATWVGDLFQTAQSPGSGNVYSGSPGSKPLGVWIYARSTDNTNNPTGVKPITTTQDPLAYHAINDWGKNDPINCVFYFGPKFFEDPNSTLDDPQGDLTGSSLPPGGGGDDTAPDLTPTDPTPNGSPCAFSFTDPTTWVSAGICQLVDLIRSLISTVSGLPAAIWALIEDGLSALFDPTDSIETRSGRVAEAFSDTFPFNLGETIETMSSNTPSGCPDWNVNVGDSSWSAVCDSSFTAAIRGARPFILAGLLAMAFWPLVRGVFYASVPLVKPAPTGGDK